MEKIFATGDIAEAKEICSLLIDGGFDAVLKNEHRGTSMLMGYLVDIEVWVRDERTYDQAADLIRQRMKQNEALEKQAQETWACTSCGEVNPGTLSVCWQCMACHDDDAT